MKVNAKFVGFTSALGGAGTTSAAVSFGQLAAGARGEAPGGPGAERQAGRSEAAAGRACYLSFDFLSSKCVRKSDINRGNLYDMFYEPKISSALMLFEEPGGAQAEGPGARAAGGGTAASAACYDDLLAKDEFGLYYFTFSDLINPLHMQTEGLAKLFEKLAASFDCVVIDVPSNCILGVEVLPYCDDIVEVYGADQSRYYYCDEHVGFLEKLCPDSKIHRLYFSSNQKSDLQSSQTNIKEKVKDLAFEIKF